MADEIIKDDGGTDFGKPIITSRQNEPKKAQRAQKVTTEDIEGDHRRRVESDLIQKAYRAFIASVASLVIVFFIGYFFEGDSTLVFEIIRLLSTIITLILGFLFATTRKDN